MKRLLLLRHATTEHTGKRLTGWTPGVHLGSKGVREASALAERLAPVEIQAIYSSPLERCQETAAAVAERQGLEVSIVEDLGEVRFGDWTGKELGELAKTDLWRTVQFHPSGARFPGGESILEMQTRAVLACERLRADHPGETVAVCSHADVIKAVVAHYLGMHLDLFQRLVVTKRHGARLRAGAPPPAPQRLRRDPRPGPAPGAHRAGPARRADRDQGAGRCPRMTSIP